MFQYTFCYTIFPISWFFEKLYFIYFVSLKFQKSAKTLCKGVNILKSSIEH